MEILILILIVVFIGFFVYVAFTKRGKGMFFGGELVKTIGDKVGTRQGIINANVRVHIVKTKLPYPNEFQVGLELSQTSFASFQMTPVTLSKKEASVLIDMLTEAVAYQ